MTENVQAACLERLAQHSADTLPIGSAITSNGALVYDDHGGSHDIDVLGCRWNVCRNGLRGRFYYFSQGSRADTTEKLPKLSSARPNRADVILNLSGHAPVG